MHSWEFGQLIYLVLLLAAVGSWFFVQRRDRLPKLMQQSLVWAFLFIAVIAAYGMWDDIRRTVLPQQSVHSSGQIELPRAPDGHYYLTALINGAPVRFVVDTGATGIVMSLNDARKVGIPEETLIFAGEAMTANGPVKTAPVSLKEFQVGPYADRNVRAWVNGGKMDSSLLGMSYLQRYSKIEMTPRALLLTR